MNSPSEFTVAMWVQFETPGETGTYFTLYSVGKLQNHTLPHYYALTYYLCQNKYQTNLIFPLDNEDHPTNRRVLMQAVNSGVYVNFFIGDSSNPSIFLQFPAYVPIANGQWHHIAITWSGKI